MSSDHLTRRGWLAGAALTTAHLAQASKTAASSDPLQWSLTQAADALKKRTISSEELTKLCLARIHLLEPKLNAVITLQEETALAQARECDRRRAADSSVGPLYGIPIALKDKPGCEQLRQRMSLEIECRRKTPKSRGA